MKLSGPPLSEGFVTVAVIAACVLTFVSCGAGAEDRTASAVSPVFSPDGATIAFSLVTGEKTETAAVPSAGG